VGHQQSAALRDQKTWFGMKFPGQSHFQITHSASRVKYDSVLRVRQYVTTDPHHLGDDGEDSALPACKDASALMEAHLGN